MVSSNTITLAMVILFHLSLRSYGTSNSEEKRSSNSIKNRRSIMNMVLNNDHSKNEFCESEDMKRNAKQTNERNDTSGESSEADIQTTQIDKKETTNAPSLDEETHVTDKMDEYETNTNGEQTNKPSHGRIKLPPLDKLTLYKSVNVTLPGDIETNVTVLSINPLVIEVDNFIDEEECDLLLSLTRAKSPKVVKQQIQNMKIQTVKQTFSEWDYDEDGQITREEVSRLPGLADIIFTREDVDDMFFLLKMDQNGDKKIDLQEMKSTDFHKLRKYINTLKSQEWRKRNITSQGAWVWHDEDELLKFAEYGYFEEFHDRISSITDIPSDIIRESEPLQVKHYSVKQFQVIQQDSQPVQHHVACCMYGDKEKCRNCRYISYAIFLNNVDEGGQLVFPMANHPFQNLMNNSGIWRGYYMYSKSTGHKYYFQVEIKFEVEGANRIFSAEGNEDKTSFSFINGIVIGNQVSFEKAYNNGEKEFIRYSGKEIDGTKIVGNWWVPHNKRYRGNFFMWNREYEIYSKTVIDQANHQETCSNSKLVIKPSKGKAVFWYNHHIDALDGMVGELDQESMTAHCEVVKGDKWVATSWINIIGDGDLELRAWRRGYNLLRGKTNIYEKLGTNEQKLNHEAFEEDFLADIEHVNGTVGGDIPGYYKHKPSSNALQALTLLLNEMSANEMKLLASSVEKKLGLQCIPLVQKHGGKIHVIDGSKE